MHKKKCLQRMSQRLYARSLEKEKQECLDRIQQIDVILANLNEGTATCNVMR